MDLEARRIIHALKPRLAHIDPAGGPEGTYTPNATKVRLRSSLENLHIKPVTNAVRSSRDTSQARSNNSNLGSTKLCSRLRSIWREEEVEQPLPQLIYENEWVEDGFLHHGRQRDADADADFKEGYSGLK